MGPIIRDCGPNGHAESLAAVLGLYPRAFRDEELRPLVTALVEQVPDALSLAAMEGDRPVGHVLFTPFVAGGGERPTARGALLGPLAVAPDRQRRSIGGALVRDGFVRLKGAGVTRAFVLGDPAYYGRLGFEPERRTVPPYALPLEWEGAWQSIGLVGDAEMASGPSRCQRRG